MSGINRTIFGGRTSLLGIIPRIQRGLRIGYLRRHAFAVAAGEGMALCRILGRYKLYVDPDDWGIAPHLMLDGYWEPRATEAIVDRLKPGMTAIDVGANCGYFTVLMAALTGPDGRVLAFEPNPASVRRLRASLAVNGLEGQVALHPEPLGATEGEQITLYIPPNHPGGTQRAHEAQEGAEHFVAQVRRLDAVPGALDAAFVKIDTEGMEEAVWRGMSAMIAGSRLRTVLIEFNGNCYADNGAVMIDEALAAGFALHRLDHFRGVVRTSRAEILGQPAGQMQMLLLER